MSAASPEPMLGAKNKPGPAAIIPTKGSRNNRTFVQFGLGSNWTNVLVGSSGIYRPEFQSLILIIMARLFSFPNPVNEKAARVVAGVVLITVVVILATGAYWLLVPLAYGFWARVLTGPTLSPLGWAAQNVIAPRLGPKKPVPGPPKRFAQGMGAAMATAALVLGLILGDDTAADVILGLFVIAAGLESIFAVCLGCQVFGVLMRIGVIPASVCEECADISRRLRATA